MQNTQTIYAAFKSIRNVHNKIFNMQCTHMAHSVQASFLLYDLPDGACIDSASKSGSGLARRARTHLHLYHACGPAVVLSVAETAY
jgi:hypothetical protein